MNGDEDIPTQDNESGRDSPPQVPMDSPGSSVSSRLQQEYSQLLKYTVESTPGLKSLSPFFESNNTASNSLTNVIETAMTAQDGQDHVLEMLTMDKNEPQNRNASCNTQSALDVRMVVMGEKLDGWLGKLKENILEELLSSLIASLDSQQDEHKKATFELHTEKASLQKEVNLLTEKINSLEHSLQQKSTVVKNLTDSLAAQKKKVEMARNFYCWKAGHSDKQREIFTEKLAVEHHQRKLNLRVLKAWYGLIQNRWRGHVERKCQSQAQSMCLELTSDYEAKISALNNTISSLGGKVSMLQAEREMYSEQVKKAFMRGMCALNMETMSVFGDEQKQQKTSDDRGGFNSSPTRFDEISYSDSITDKLESENSKSLPEAQITLSTSPSTSSHPCPPHYDVQISQLPHPIGGTSCKESRPASHPKPKPKSSKGPSHIKLISPSQVLAPPMASVVVERHQPVNKKTLGKATAIQFPKKKTGLSTKPISKKDNKVSSPMHFKPLAGQDNRDIFFKVVE